MDINARINWMPGMELTAQTFLEMADHWSFRQRLAMRAALGSNRMGLLPGEPFNCKGIFVKNRYEINHLQCMALLPSGRIVNAEEDVQVTIPMLFGDKYYLTIGYGDEQTEFEKEGVPFVRPHYVYNINTEEEVEAGDLFPLARFKVSDGVFAVDTDYVPPCLLLTEHPCFKEYIDKYVERLAPLAEHKNFENGEGKRALQRYMFMLKGYDLMNNMQAFVLLTQEIAQAIDYCIVIPNREQRVEVPRPSQIDIQAWLQWLDIYLLGAGTILDGVVLEDNTIDYDALLAQAKKELYEKLHPELLEKLIMQTKEELHQEIQQLTDSLTIYIRETLKTELANQLSSDIEFRSTQLSERLAESMDLMGKDMAKALYDKLFSDIYIGVYNVLHEEEEDHFIPMI